MALVSLDTAKDHLRITHNYEDGTIERMLMQAEAIVLAYIADRRHVDDQTAWDAEIATWDEETVPGPVQAAILCQAGELHRYRGDDDKQPWREPGDLSPYIKALLRRYRDPVVA